MTQDLPPAEIGKIAAAGKAIEYVEDGMKLGLGTGSTAAWLVKLLAQRTKDEGLKVDCCATSEVTTELAESLGIKIHKLDDLGALDLAIDGADEFDPQFNLIKGAGGALLREKIVEAMAERFVVITDASKEVQNLGAFTLPVEVVQFSWQTTALLIEDTLKTHDVDGRQFARRGGETPFITDEGHFIFDLDLKKISNPTLLHDCLLLIPGVVETGLFLDMATDVVVGSGDGTVRFRSTAEVEWANDMINVSNLLASIG